MAALKASNPEQLRVPGVHVSSDGAGGRVTRVESYYAFTVEWRGQPVQVDVSGDIYEYHGGNWSEWRYIVRRTDPAVSDTARRAISDAVQPLCRRWTASPGYVAAYRRAVAQLVARTIRDEGTRYGVERCRQQLATVADDLDADDLARLTEAVDALARCVELVELVTAARRLTDDDDEPCCASAAGGGDCECAELDV